MKVCVLQPDYSTSGVDYQNYDPPRDLSRLLPEAEVHHISLNKLTTYKQLRALSKQQFDIFVNLCEGYLEWEVPSIDVIHTLELLGLPFTGPSANLYDPTKELMKYVAYCVGVDTPGYVRIDQPEAVKTASQLLKYPLFVKPAKAGDSLGIDEHSRVSNEQELLKKVNAIIEEYGPLLAEEYIDGREFTVLVAANADGKTCTAFKPVEYIFPAGRSFKTYALKTSELHPDANIPCNDPTLEKKLKDAAEKIFLGFQGVGYARLDFRVDAAGKIYFLEINFTCSVFYRDGYEGSADFILKFDGIGQAGFLKHMITEGIARHARKKKCYEMRGNSIAGYGIYAVRNISTGEVIFKGEGKSQRVITKRHVEKYWNEEEKLNFRRYAYPISEEVFILWDEEPSEWAPQNHSCEANTAFDGLDVRALRDIREGEELTLDYAHFLDHHMEPFDCQCGSASCKKLIRGPEANSLNLREQTLRG